MSSQNHIVGDFRNCLWFIWKHVIEGQPDPTPVQYDVASFLADPSKDRIIIEGFRGVGKSQQTGRFIPFASKKTP